MGLLLFRRSLGGTSPIDPATQPLSWWARAPYVYSPSAAPLVGLASAGSSGSKSLGYNGSPPTRTGYALNGLEGMAGEGHHDSLVDNDGTPHRMGEFISLSAYTIGFLLKAGAPNEDAQNRANEFPLYLPDITPLDARYHRGVVSDGGLTKWGLFYVPNGGDSGLYTLAHVDSGGLKTVAVEGALEEVCIVQAGYNGSNIWIQKNGEPPVTASAGSILESTPGDFTNAGTWWELDAFDAAHFGGVIWDRWASDQNLYAQRDGFRAYVNQRYALSL